MKIITDSTCDLSLDFCRQHDIEMLSLRVSFGDAEYSDKRTITNEEFYSKLAEYRELPKTSMLSIGDFQEAFDRFPDQEILVILISSKLSGTYHSAVMAKEDSGRSDIYLIDSGSAAVALGLLVEVACRLRNGGRPAAEIAGEIRQLTGKLRLYGTVDTLQYLIKGGRLPKAVGMVAEALNYKPILTLEHGELVKKETARGKKAAMNRLVRIGLEESEIDPALPVGFAGFRNMSEVEQLQAAYGTFQDQLVVEIGSVIGTHVGTGGLIIAFFTK
jgi:DegV family protein with EDD domain